MATVQKDKAGKDSPGEIYVAIDTEALDSLQPVTIDVQTYPRQKEVIRAYIYKYQP